MTVSYNDESDYTLEYPLTIGDAAPVESPDDESRVSNSSEPHLNAKELKEKISFSRLLELDGHDLVAGGQFKRCNCPFHNDRSKQFYIRECDSKAFCYKCKWKGDIYDYLCQRKGCKKSFSDAFRLAKEYMPKILRLPSAHNGANKKEAAQ